MPIVSSSKCTVESLSLAHEPVAVACIDILVAGKAGVEYRLADPESPLVIRVVADEVTLEDDEEGIVRVGLRELRALAHLCDVWQTARIQLAGRVGYGKTYKWYPTSALAYAPTGTASPRIVPVNDPEVDVIRERFERPKLVRSKRLLPALVVTHDVVTRGGECIAIVMRDEHERSRIFTRRNLFATDHTLTSTSALAIVKWLEFETVALARDGIALDFEGTAIVKASLQLKPKKRRG